MHDEERIDQLEGIYKKMYMLYDDDQMGAEIVLFNAHADTEEKLEKIINDLFNSLLDNFTKQGICAECGISEDDVDLLK